MTDQPVTIEEIDEALNISEEAGDSSLCYNVLKRLRNQPKSPIYTPDDRPTIKMSKNPPTTNGYYWWSKNSGDTASVVFISPGLWVGTPYDSFHVSNMGGYWANFELSMLEFEYLL